MKRIFSILFALVLAVSLMLVPAAVSAQPKKGVPWVLWGVTGINFCTVNDYSEVFKVNTATGVVTIIAADTSGPLYSDVAMTPNGRLYTVGMDRTGTRGSPANFYDFHRLDPKTGAILQSWINVFPNNGFRQVNALCAESNKSLLAIEGGGAANPKLLRINLDAKGNLSSIVSLGPIAAPGAASCLSDGDLDRDPASGKWYAGFWKLGPPPVWGVSEMLELNLTNPSNSTVVSDSGMPCQGGFAFRFDGTAYAGSWAGKILYTVDVLNGGSTLAYDLSGDLAGNIYGLSSRVKALRGRP